jgi:uncharacterized protein (DUF433 family)
MMILEPMNRSNTMDWRGAVREGIYPVAFAAKLAETTNARVASWFRASNGSKLSPAILTPFPPVDRQIVMPFLALVESRFVAHFRKHGLSLQTIRKVAQKLRDKHNIGHPFATETRFRTDGKRIMMEEAADDGERRLLDIMTDELAFPSVLERSLFKSVIYADDIATQMTFEEFPQIIVDPKCALGRPVVRHGFVPTETLAAAFLAEGDVKGVAAWYDTEVDDVTQAVAFQQRLAA